MLKVAWIVLSSVYKVSAQRQGRHRVNYDIDIIRHYDTRWIWMMPFMVWQNVCVRWSA